VDKLADMVARQDSKEVFEPKRRIVEDEQFPVSVLVAFIQNDFKSDVEMDEVKVEPAKPLVVPEPVQKPIEIQPAQKPVEA